MMRVLITIADMNGPGGIAHYYKALRGLFADSVDYMVVGSRFAGVELPGVIRMIFDYLVFAVKVPRYELIHFNPSLCLKCFLREAIFIFVAKLFRKKTIVFFRGWEKPFEKKVEQRWLWLFKLTYARTDAMIVLANEFTTTLRRWGYTSPVFLETTTVDERLLDGFDLSERVSDSGTLNILFLARVEEQKGVFEAVDAVEKLGETNVCFRIGGDGGAKTALEKHIKNHGYRCSEVCGYMRGEKKIAAYREANLFLFPSYHGEGMPNSVLEAMAFGLPVVTCPTGGIKDFFKDGKMGFLVSPRDTDAVASALARLMEDPVLREKISKYNAQYAREHFYSSRVADRLQKIYEKTMNSGEK